jgi:hypothetical protein
MEKSSKNNFLCLGESLPEGYPSHPPPHRVENARSLHVEETRFQDADAESRHGIETRRKGKGGENNAKLNNSSTEQYFGGIFYTKIDIPFLLLIALTKCAYLLLASLASKNRVLYSEGRVYKRMPELAASPQLPALHSIGNTSVKNSVSRTKSATATHVE